MRKITLKTAEAFLNRKAMKMKLKADTLALMAKARR